MTRRVVRPPVRLRSAGVTLIEMMVALALFAIIGTAGFSILDTVLRVQDRTEGRIARLGGMQRAMYLLVTDFALERPHSFDASKPGGISFLRSGGAAGTVRLRYGFADGVIERQVTASATAQPVRQSLLAGVAGLTWRFLDRDAGWVDAWPPPETVRTLGLPPPPLAVEATILLTDGTRLRRVAVLPQAGA